MNAIKHYGVISVRFLTIFAAVVVTAAALIVPACRPIVFEKVLDGLLCALAFSACRLLDRLWRSPVLRDGTLVEWSKAAVKTAKKEVIVGLASGMALGLILAAIKLCLICLPKV